MDGDELKRALKAHAIEIGLDLIGVARAEPFTADADRLRERQQAGLGPNPYEYQQIEPRVNPELLLPGARTLIAGGISYLMEDEPLAAGLTGWLSRYCRGLDYHGLLKARLGQVASWLEAAVPGARTLVHVDTGPPLDRSVAERAGIGKWGKHTNLITREFGTWVFLGEILTDIDLPPDEPVAPACGECTLCIDACPTQCLTEWKIDANRCLSYVTQMKGMIPTEFRETMGNRLFGCDDCQDVCPYNRKARRGLHPEFASHPEVGGAPDLLKLMNMTKGDFRRWFEPSAAGWRGKTTIQRNAVIALGNAGDPGALEPLVKALGSESQPVRAHAAWGLGRLAGAAPGVAEAARAALENRRRHESDPDVLAEIEGALANEVFGSHQG
ncbi:MAG TPA: tRNA epoxyqueuosine(34) reductase QueG [Symbiobacteriaceae bacterium]|nr:tRNA epoxyqueuosine(34) reductase QueG [Symbiobacteriaceae bacterium]